MALTKTPICDFGKNADDFRLKSTDNKILSLNELKGEKGTLIMFICNHCPYVKAVIKDIVEDCAKLKNYGINSVAISSNDHCIRCNPIFARVFWFFIFQIVKHNLYNIICLLQKLQYVILGKKLMTFV